MAEYIEVIGGRPLSGSVRVSGAKNATLPMLLASILTAEPCRFGNVPNLSDVTLVERLLEHLGGEIEHFENRFHVRVPSITATDTSYSLVKALRASFWVLGPLLARAGAARVALPGGDIIGARPVDIHLEALQRMGADISIKHGVVWATAPRGLKPADLEFRFPSVGATHQIILAAALTPGTTIIRGAAREPEVVALADLINRMGGTVTGAGSATIEIHGVKELGGAEIDLIGDRIEAGTYLLAAAATGGTVRVEGVAPEHLGEFPDILRQIGLQVESGLDYVSLRSPQRPLAADAATAPFPGLATDLQAPLMALLTIAEGQSTIEENVYEGRFGHAAELCRMGAKITIDGRQAVIQGVEKLSAAPVEAFDIRAAAALVIGALAAEGTSRIFEPDHIRRGYEQLDLKLRRLGAEVRFCSDDADDFDFIGC